MHKTVEHCLGSVAFPMSDSDLQTKFLAQAELAVGQVRAAELLDMCWHVEDLEDAGALARKACGTRS